jgi:hypothetical protein
VLETLLYEAAEILIRGLFNPVLLGHDYHLDRYQIRAHYPIGPESCLGYSASMRPCTMDALLALGRS